MMEWPKPRGRSIAWQQWPPWQRAWDAAEGSLGDDVYSRLKQRWTALESESEGESEGEVDDGPRAGC